MNHFVLLSSLGALTGANLLIHFAFYGTPVTITEKHMTVERVDRACPRIFIPDVLAGWPWPRQINPYYLEVERESNAWVVSLKPLSDKVMDRGRLCLIISLCHPVASKDVLRATCDLNHFMFTFDEYSDKATPSEVRKMKDIVLDAFQNPLTSRPEGELILGEMARQLWERVTQISTDSSQKELIQKMDRYLEACVQQSVDREQCHIRDVEGYIRERRITVGAKPLFWCNMLGFNIPSKVMSHTAIQEMTDAAAEMIALCNDIISYNVEQMRGDDLHNVITCVMNEHHTDVNGAILWVDDHLSGLQGKFLAAMGSLPQWEEPLNSHVKGYCNGLGHWVRGSLEWHFECERYFAKKGPEIRKNKWMALLPKKAARRAIGPMEVDGSLL